MSEQPLMKNIPFSESLVLSELTDYAESRVVSRTLAQNGAVGVTLFAFDRGEGLSAHTTPGDAMVYVLDGEALITIGGEEMTVKTGEAVVMPADVPHALDAKERFKMLLVVVKRPKEA
jgi:quercetin dioxygenase-like cupin family protein